MPGGALVFGKFTLLVSPGGDGMPGGALFFGTSTCAAEFWSSGGAVWEIGTVDKSDSSTIYT
jgi:hypothetical protein